MAPLCSLSHPLPAGLQAVQELWGSMADKLLDAMTLEVDSDVWAVMADSLCKVRRWEGDK